MLQLLRYEDVNVHGTSASRCRVDSRIHLGDGRFLHCNQHGLQLRVIYNSKRQAGQFQVGLALLIVGAAGLAFWVGFTL